LLGVADLGDSEAEVFGYFYGFALAYHFVVDHQFQGLVVAFGEFDDGAYAEAHDLVDVELTLG
jgi:hypothetical protein